MSNGCQVTFQYCTLFRLIIGLRLFTSKSRVLKGVQKVQAAVHLIYASKKAASKNQRELIDTP